MLHPEYHTCDKCGKVIKKYGHPFDYRVTTSVPYALTYPEKIEEVCNDESEKATGDLVHDIETNIRVAVFCSSHDYELCKQCSKTLRGMIEKFIKE